VPVREIDRRMCTLEDRGKEEAKGIADLRPEVL
jgi:hypothetical protein